MHAHTHFILTNASALLIVALSKYPFATSLAAEIYSRTYWAQLAMCVRATS